MNALAVYSSASARETNSADYYEIIFVGAKAKIRCYNASKLALYPKPFKILTHASGSTINQIKALKIGGIPCLVAACHNHKVIIYTIEDLDRPPIVLEFAPALPPLWPPPRLNQILPSPETTSLHGDYPHLPLPPNWYVLFVSFASLSHPWLPPSPSPHSLLCFSFVRPILSIRPDSTSTIEF